MNALLFTVRDQLGGGVVWVKLNLVDGGGGFARGGVEKDSEIVVTEVRYADVAGH